MKTTTPEALFLAKKRNIEGRDLKQVDPSSLPKGYNSQARSGLLSSERLVNLYAELGRPVRQRGRIIGETTM